MYVLGTTAHQTIQNCQTSPVDYQPYLPQHNAQTYSEIASHIYLARFLWPAIIHRI
jgi:hypothetical protein